MFVDVEKMRLESDPRRVLSATVRFTGVLAVYPRLQLSLPSATSHGKYTRDTLVTRFLSHGCATLPLPTGI